MGDTKVNSNINAVSVDKWKSGDNKSNNCWWNIAKNQLGDSATAQEIAELTQRLQEYNTSKNNNIVRQNDIIMECDEVLIPIDLAIEEINANIETASTENDNLRAQLYGDMGLEMQLQIADSAVSSAQASLNQAEQTLNSYTSVPECPHFDDYSGDTASSDYSKALNNYKAYKRAQTAIMHKKPTMPQWKDSRQRKLIMIKQKQH